MSRRFTAVIVREDEWYVGHCLEFGVVSQGTTIEDAQRNLREAVELYVERFGVADIPSSTGEVLLYPFDVAVSA